MPTNHDETLPQRYAREYQDYLKLCGSMTAEQVADIQLQLHNSLAREQALQQRLTAADERVDVLETALKKISARCVAYIDAEREMPEPSIEVRQMIASAALKTAEANDSCEFCKGWGFRANPDGADEGCGACNGTGKEPAEVPYAHSGEDDFGHREREQ